MVKGLISLTCNPCLLPHPKGGSSTLSAEVMPDRSDADFEPALRTILGRMRSLGSTLDFNVEVGGFTFSGMKWLTGFFTLASSGKADSVVQ